MMNQYTAKNFKDPTYMIMSTTDGYVGSAVYADWNSAVAQANEYAASTELQYYIVRIEGTTMRQEPQPPEPYVQDLYGSKYFS